MSHQVRNNEAESRFEVRVEGDVAYAEYRLHDGVITLPHTIVPEAFEGQGVGGALARFALDYARREGLEVIPTCSFMAGFIQRHAEYQDLVAADCRARLGLD